MLAKDDMLQNLDGCIDEAIEHIRVLQKNPSIEGITQNEYTSMNGPAVKEYIITFKPNKVVTAPENAEEQCVAFALKNKIFPERKNYASSPLRVGIPGYAGVELRVGSRKQELRLQFIYSVPGQDCRFQCPD